MIKVSFRNILFYIFLKYFVFYIFLMIRNGDYTLINLNRSKNFDNWFYYLWMFLSLPVIVSILFSAVIFYSFKIKSSLVFGLVICSIFIAEYFLYTYLASQADLMNGFYNAIISLIIYLLFFFKKIALKFNHVTDK
jgi:hypothetical protein